MARRRKAGFKIGNKVPGTIWFGDFIVSEAV